MVVDVYRNLHRHGPNGETIWSVKHKGRLVSYETAIVLRDVQFIVRPGERARALREGQRNVHAVARGEWQQGSALLPGVPVTYAPFERGEFFRKDTLASVFSADGLSLSSAGVFAQNPK